MKLDGDVDMDRSFSITKVNYRSASNRILSSYYTVGYENFTGLPHTTGHWLYSNSSTYYLCEMYGSDLTKSGLV